MIEVKDLTKYYGDKEGRFKALDNVSVSIKDGEFIVILGASGSGKSTFLNVISGLETIDSGSVSFNGFELSKMSEKELTKFRKDNTAYIFQQYYLLPHLNVEKNVRMGADLSGTKDFLSYLEAVGLKEKAKKFPSQLSGGEQQRVAIARALAKKPKVLFLDEPTGALDEKTGRAVLDYIIKLKDKLNFTMIMVTHNENIAQTADRIIKMNSGKIVDVSENAHKKDAYEIGW
ncbi:MAG: ABC transporter ATP-binding protein [Lachnospiraceae bacterium]|nr:ABC transporter ATP-binding protein [Lachnospiraceae bacterium]